MFLGAGNSMIASYKGKVTCNLKSSKFHNILSKYKLIRIESNAMSSTNLKPPGCLKEAVVDSDETTLS